MKNSKQTSNKISPKRAQQVQQAPGGIQQTPLYQQQVQMPQQMNYMAPQTNNSNNLFSNVPVGNNLFSNGPVGGFYGGGQMEMDVEIG